MDRQEHRLMLNASPSEGVSYIIARIYDWSLGFLIANAIGQ